MVTQIVVEIHLLDHKAIAINATNVTKEATILDLPGTDPRLALKALDAALQAEILRRK